mmetsp:Transcript_71958/g.208452  ORF Transcript_71958/g.208452 Transcript_71958/m.208452 type:complete len:223 (+) Transcript_71958:646-1314(+)
MLGHVGPREANLPNAHVRRANGKKSPGINGHHTHHLRAQVGAYLVLVHGSVSKVELAVVVPETPGRDRRYPCPQDAVVIGTHTTQSSKLGFAVRRTDPIEQLFVLHVTLHERFNFSELLRNHIRRPSRTLLLKVALQHRHKLVLHGTQNIDAFFQHRLLDGRHKRSLAAKRTHELLSLRGRHGPIGNIMSVLCKIGQAPKPERPRRKDRENAANREQSHAER